MYFEPLESIERRPTSPTPVFADDLPPQYLARYTVGFLHRYFVSFLTVGWKLRAPGLHLLACTAEELALHAIIDPERSYHYRGHGRRESDQVEALPRFLESEYAPPPAHASPGWGYPEAGLLWPLHYPFPTPGVAAPENPEMEAVLRQLHQENAVVGVGSEVLDRHGEKIGSLRRISFDTATGRQQRRGRHALGRNAGLSVEAPPSACSQVRWPRLSPARFLYWVAYNRRPLLQQAISVNGGL